MTDLKIDIVVPSYRLDLGVLEKIHQLEIPMGVRRTLIVVADNPEPSNDLLAELLQGWDGCQVIRNPENLGAGASRNVGIEAGSGDWILFLDDDADPHPDLLLRYKQAIDRNPEATGFMGITTFPSATNSFTRGIQASDILTFFNIARHRDEAAWGVTANLMVHRESLGNIRFDPRFPKNGGGEDIDFCLRLAARTKNRLICVPKGQVEHPWWKNGDREYKRFFRWAYGDASLPRLHPEHRYRNYPNVVEASLIWILIAAILTIVGITHPVVAFAPLSGIWAGELIAEHRRIRPMQTRFIESTESALIRASNDMGRLISGLTRLRPQVITERFDFLTTGEWIHLERAAAFRKTLYHVIGGAITFAMAWLLFY